MTKRVPRPTPVWQPERVALLLSRYATEGAAALVAPLNELAGIPLTINSVKEKVWSLRLRMDPDARRRLQQRGSEIGRNAMPQNQPGAVKRAAPEPPKMRAADLSLPRAGFIAPIPPAPNLPPEEQAALADAAMDRKRAKALAMLAKKACPHAVASNARLPLREVFRLIGEMRA